MSGQSGVFVPTEPSHDVFQAIADPTRRTILQLLAGEELAIVDIAHHFEIGRTAVNKHLHVLADAGLVTSRKAGRETRYQLQAQELVEVREWLSFFEQYWDEQLFRLKNLVESPGSTDVQEP